MLFKPYKKEDKSELVEVFKLNVPAYFDQSEITLFQDYLDQKGGDFFTMKYESRIVGGVGINVEDGAGSIVWIFIHPNFKNKGFGKVAVNHCLDLYRKNVSVEKVVVRTSQMSYKFFEQFGFELISTEPNYWAEGFDLYYMNLKNWKLK